MQPDSSPTVTRDFSAVKRDYSPSMKRDCSPTKCDFPSSTKPEDASSIDLKDDSPKKDDGSPSLFNKLSESMVEVEEESRRDTLSNLEEAITINVTNSPQDCPQLKLGRCLEKPTAIPDLRHRFFDPQMKTERLNYIKATALSTLMTALVVLGVLSIYWGTLWKLDQHAYKLKGIIVDFDQDAVGKSVLQATQERTGSPQQITWTVTESSVFNHDVSNVAQSLLDEHCWVAIVVQPASTQKLQQAVSSGDSAYDGTNAVTVYVTQARQEQAYSHFILPQIADLLKSAQLSFRKQHARSLSQNPEFNLTKVMENAPQIIINPFDYKVNDLRPFDVSITTAMTALGLIYVTLAALVSCTHSLQARTELALREKLTLRSFVQVRICSPLISYFWISLSYALLSVFFHVPFGRFRGASGLLLCWIMFFLGMSALGLTVEVVTVILTPQYVSYFMIFWVIWNISVCYLPIDVLPSIYKYAYISPFYNVNRAARAIILDAKNDLAINFAVQLTWIVISTINIILYEIWKRRKLRVLSKRSLVYAQ